MNLESISTTGIKDRLRDLKEIRTAMPEVVYSFAEELAGRLNGEITPGGFIATASLLLRDSMRGMHHYTREPIENELTGLKPAVYMALNNYVPLIAEAVCPDHFAQMVYDVAERKNLDGPRKLSRKF